MALFKVYHGGKNQSEHLPGEIKDSYGYIVVKPQDEEEPGTMPGTWIDDFSVEHYYGIGEWYIDAGGTRYRLAAAELIGEDGQLYTLDDLVLEGNLKDKMIEASYNESSQQSNLTASEQQKMQIALDVAKAEDSISEAFQISVPAGSWIQDTAPGSTYYIKAVILPESLHCGNISASTPVPPIVQWAGGSDLERARYDRIVKVVLENDGAILNKKLVFYVEATEASLVASGSFSVIVIDHR